MLFLLDFLLIASSPLVGYFLAVKLADYWQYPMSSEYRRALRKTVWIYAALLFFASMSTVPSINSFAAIFTVFIIVQLGIEVYKSEKMNTKARRTYWLTILGFIFLLGIAIIHPMVVQPTLFTSLAISVMNTAITLAFCYVWIFEYPISEQAKGRLLGLAAYTLSLMFTVSFFLLYAYAS